jgi:hypothetical protein
MFISGFVHHIRIRNKQPSELVNQSAVNVFSYRQLVFWFHPEEQVEMVRYQAIGKYVDVRENVFLQSVKEELVVIVMNKHFS